MLIRLFLLTLFLLLPLVLYAQEEKQDSVTSDKKSILTTVANGVVTLKDDVASAVRHTGRKIKKVGKEFNAIDTTYISPNLYNLAFMLEHSTWYEHYRLGVVILGVCAVEGGTYNVSLSRVVLIRVLESRACRGYGQERGKY